MSLKLEKNKLLCIIQRVCVGRDPPDALADLLSNTPQEILHDKEVSHALGQLMARDFTVAVGKEEDRQ